MQTIKFFAILMAAASTELAAENLPSRRLIVSVADRKIVLLEDGKVVKTYPVAVGKRSTPSPSGSFHIASHVANPTYWHEGKVVKPGPANPVGTRWMGLGFKGYGIHGTNHPESIGHAASHGCIRMRNQDVQELFELVRVGDEVELVTTPAGDLARLFAEPAADATQAKTMASVSTVGGLQ
jgi:lipoprotein-anchoring transpeptidase ErfK/SrfK